MKATRLLEPVQTTADLVANAIRKEISMGELKPNEPLRQETLAAQFGVSRIPVRDALRRLEAEGLVVILPNRGAFVASLGVAEIREIYDIRRMLEGDLLVRAIEVLRPEDFEAIETAMMIAEAGSQGENWSNLDDKFHEQLYAVACRPKQLAMVMQLRESVRRYRSAHQSLHERTASWLGQHQEIVNACKASNAILACQVLDEHLRIACEIAVANLLGQS